MVGRGGGGVVVENSMITASVVERRRADGYQSTTDWGITNDAMAAVHEEGVCVRGPRWTCLIQN